MRTVPFSISGTLLPRIVPDDINNRCVSLHEYYSSPKAIWAPGRHAGFRATNGSTGIASSNRVQSPVVPISVPVRVAHELLQAGHHYLDVRTSDEFSSGHVVGAVNVPFMLRLGPGMTRNPRFVEEVLAHFRKDDEIIVGCQLGKRSLMASSELLSAGFTGITDMAGGYAAWIRNGLPTE
ncbi:hypothetical protein RD792_001154 [Penstemon davidsonii]|uniref:Rhodanese domain-containing protein n=1 Tax=Penstemon davidsonii TaxID=160366 RepID=A0ABR0DMW7_9LAMI|nr:hypothetical protein RD792_001154 [Penstemon davidsonii]